MSPAVLLRIIRLVRERERDETTQYEEHPSDDYQRGRAMATKGLLKEIFAIITPPSQNG